MLQLELNTAFRSAVVSDLLSPSDFLHELYV